MVLWFLLGLLVGGGGVFFVLLVYGLCTVSKRADEAAEKADHLPDPKRKTIAVMVRGDESVVN